MNVTLKPAIYLPGLISLMAPGMLLAQAPSTGEESAPVQAVGQPPPEEELQPEVQSVPDIGGVLTPRGRLVLEPELQYSHSSVNRITFRGVEILDTLAVGALSAEDTNRDTWNAALTARLGVTNRLEMEFKVPYTYRRDEFNAAGPSPVGASGAQERELTGDGLGDIELALHRQLSEGRGGAPFLVGNLRYKSTTGEGPFDIERDENGEEEELATGSGFHSIEPSITLLFPSDPAVYFANIGYLWNLEDDSVDQRITSADGSDEFNISEVDPGDAVRISFGMAYSINPRTSFTLGYKNDFIGETETTFTQNGNSSTQTSSRLNVGSMLLGWSYQLDQQTAVNVGLEFGITDDAPDTTLTMRVPFGMNVF